ncbi:MAG: HEAT repeat domain-containing protein, partial [Planctomycetota bacterium]
GRGLPDNLNAVQVKEGEIATRKLQGRVDGLLADLEQSSDAKVEAVQAAVVEAVQLDRPEDLIGQVDRLKKLATDTRVEVRRTAMWALGRTGNISGATLLIRGLSDADESVSREASVGLSILSRKPEGCGLPIDPTEGLKDDASDEERKMHLDKWRKDSASLWQKWYFKVRPYDERDDRTLLKRKS